MMKNPDFEEWDVRKSLGHTRIWYQRVCKKHAGEYVECPVCSHSQITNRRRILPGDARALSYIYDAYGAYVPVPTGDDDMFALARRYNLDRRLPSPHGLRWFGILEPVVETLPDGSDKRKRGHYMITELGEDWLLGRKSVPKFVWFRDRQFVAESVETVEYADVLGDEGFHWDRDLDMDEPLDNVVGIRSRRWKTA